MIWFTSFRGISVRIKMYLHNTYFKILELCSCLWSKLHPHLPLKIKSPVGGSWRDTKANISLNCGDFILHCVYRMTDLGFWSEKCGSVFPAIGTFEQWSQQSRLKDSQSPTRCRLFQDVSAVLHALCKCLLQNQGHSYILEINWKRVPADFSLESWTSVWQDNPWLAITNFTNYNCNSCN